MPRRRFTGFAWGAFALVFSFSAISCGGDSNNNSSDPVPIRGGERLAWNQGADSVQALRAHTFRLYLDGAPAQFTDTRCTEGTGPVYECSGRLPAMAPGRHVLEVASVLNGTESPRSSPLSVQLSSASQTGGVITLGASPVASRDAATAGCATLDGRCYQARIVSDGLNSLSSLTPLPDGRVLFVEDESRVRVLERGTLRPEPALDAVDRADPAARIVGLAADTHFAETGSVFVAWTEEAVEGTRLNITRYRAVDGWLGQGSRIVTGLPVAAAARVPMSVDAEGLLYVALPGAARTGRALAEESFGGAILRFDRDGSTPRGNPRSSPIVSRGYSEPTALAIDGNQRVWLAGLSNASPALSSFAIARDEWPIQPVSVDLRGLENRRGAPSAAHPMAISMSGPSMLLAANAQLYLGSASSEGKLTGVERLALDSGSPTEVASATNGSWYVALATDSGTVAIVAIELQR